MGRRFIPKRTVQMHVLSFPNGEKDLPNTGDEFRRPLFACECRSRVDQYYWPYLSFHWAVSKFQIVSCTFRLWGSCCCGQLRKRRNRSGYKLQNLVWGMVLLWVGKVA
eukprot:4856619-Ditylum_brightwellii.AAC.1